MKANTFDNIPQPKVLLYHMAPPDLECHLKCIMESGYMPVHLSHLAEFIESKADHAHLASKLFITFDDGLVNFYEIVRPLLEKYDIPATICVPTCFIAHRPDMRKVDNWENNEKSINPLMTWNELRELRDIRRPDGSPLIEIIPHSATHTNLNHLENDPPSLEYEVGHSKKALEVILGLRDIKFFSLPYGGGEGKSKIEEILISQGYTGALMVEGDGWAAFRIPRYQPSDLEGLKSWLRKT